AASGQHRRTPRWQSKRFRPSSAAAPRCCRPASRGRTSASVAKPSRRSASSSVRARAISMRPAGWARPAGAIRMRESSRGRAAGGGLLNADSFESATVSAASGGTTTVIPFAAQHVGHALDRVLDDYHRLAERGAVIDYAFHMILADPNEATLKTHLPKLVREG